MLMRRRSVVAWLGGSALLFVAAALVLPFVGPSALDWSRVWERQEPDWSILTNLRLSRTLLGLFAGGALALAGSLFQSMLRDALATPYTLGVSTGASLGAVIAIVFESAALFLLTKRRLGFHGLVFGAAKAEPQQ